jgi:hypothetical protein
MTILVLWRCHRYTVNWLHRILVQWPFVHFPKYAYSLTVAPTKRHVPTLDHFKDLLARSKSFPTSPMPSIHQINWNSAYMLACVYWPCRWWTCSYFPKSMSTLVWSKHHWGLMMSTWSCNCFVWSVHRHACSSLQVALFLASAFKRLHIMQPYFLQHSASVLSTTRVCIHINELANCTWVQQICNCLAWSV